MYKCFLYTQWFSELHVISLTLSTTAHIPLFTVCMEEIYLKGKDGRVQAAILKLTSNVRARSNSKPHMVRGWGSSLTEQELITAHSGLHWCFFFFVSYMKSWKVYGGLASHGSAKTQREDWQLRLGGAALSSQTSGCGLFMYVVSGLLHQSKSQSPKTCTCLCEWYKVKLVCDVGVWVCGCRVCLSGCFI